MWCRILSIGVIAFLKTPKITLWPQSHLYWPWITWPFCLKMFPYQHALLVPKKSNVSDLVNRSYCFFKNAQNHALTPKSPLLTLAHMTVLFENVSLPHALLVPQKSNVSDLVIRSYCFLKTPQNHVFTPKSPLLTLDHMTGFVRKYSSSTCTTCLKKLYMLNHVNFSYSRKCLKYHLWHPITPEPVIRFKWELAYSLQFIEGYHISQKYQLLFCYLFSPINKHHFSELTFDLLTSGSNVTRHSDSKKQYGKSLRPS